MEHSELLVELGAIVLGLAVLSRVATRIGMPTIPLYLTAGLAFGKGGIVPLVTAEEFVGVGSSELVLDRADPAPADAGA